MTRLCERCGKEYAVACPACPYCPPRPTHYTVSAVVVALMSLTALASAVLPAGQLVLGDEIRGGYVKFDNRMIASTGALGRLAHLLIAAAGSTCAVSLWRWKDWLLKALAGWVVLVLAWSGLAAVVAGETRQRVESDLFSAAIPDDYLLADPQYGITPEDREAIRRMQQEKIVVLFHGPTAETGMSCCQILIQAREESAFGVGGERWHESDLGKSEGCVSFAKSLRSELSGDFGESADTRGVEVIHVPVTGCRVETALAASGVHVASFVFPWGGGSLRVGCQWLQESVPAQSGAAEAACQEVVSRLLPRELR